MKKHRVINSLLMISVFAFTNGCRDGNQGDMSLGEAYPKVDWSTARKTGKVKIPSKQSSLRTYPDGIQCIIMGDWQECINPLGQNTTLIQAINTTQTPKQISITVRLQETLDFVGTPMGPNGTSVSVSRDWLTNDPYVTWNLGTVAPGGSLILPITVRFNRVVAEAVVMAYKTGYTGSVSFCTYDLKNIVRTSVPNQTCPIASPREIWATPWHCGPLAP